MDENVRKEAKSEIKLSLMYSNFSTRMVGIDFYEEDWRPTLYWYIALRCLLLASAFGIVWLFVGEFAFIIKTIIESPRIEDVVGLIHLWGYALISVAKLATIWHKRALFKKLLSELEEAWPLRATLAPDELDVKRSCLANLRVMHFWYFWINVIGVWLYILTPAAVHAFLSVTGTASELDSPWRVLYPYNNHAPVVRELTYIWESFMGFCAVWMMVGPDLLFAALASHIGMLLRLLILRLRNLAPEPAPGDTTGDMPPVDHFQEIVEIIKSHQKLIRYCQDIEDAFSLVFLINIVLSSVNICCAGFLCVLVEPLMYLSTKVFLMASLTQIGVLCWYGDDIYQVNAEVGAAAYSGGWYRCDARCRHALRFLIQRSQKPLTFTAMKFKYINLGTYTSILTTSYSYFALLNTMYTDKFSDQQ